MEIKTKIEESKYLEYHYICSLLKLITPQENIFELKYRASFDPNNQEMFSIHLATGKNVVKNGDDKKNKNIDFYFTPTKKVKHNKWNHLLLTWNQEINSTKVYLNGEDIAYLNGGVNYAIHLNRDSVFSPSGKFLNLKQAVITAIQDYLDKDYPINEYNQSKYLEDFENPTPVSLLLDNQGLVQIDELRISKNSLQQKDITQLYDNDEQWQELNKDAHTIFLSHFDDLIVTSDLVNQFTHLNKIWRYEEDREEYNQTYLYHRDNKDYYSDSKRFSILLYLFGDYKYKNNSYENSYWGDVEYTDWISTKKLSEMFKKAKEDLSIIKDKKYYLTKLFYSMDMSRESILAGMDQDWIFVKAENNNPYQDASSNRIARSKFWYILNWIFAFAIGFIFAGGPYLLLYIILFTPLILSFLWCRKILLKHSYSKFFLVCANILFAAWLGAIGFWLTRNFKNWTMFIFTAMLILVNGALFLIPFVRSVVFVKKQEFSKIDKFCKIVQIIILLLMITPTGFSIKVVYNEFYRLSQLMFLLFIIMPWLLFLWLFLRQNRQLKRLKQTELGDNLNK